MLTRQDKDIYYYKNKGEVDFLIRKGMHVESFIQVCMTSLENRMSVKRELSSIEEGMVVLKISEGTIITEDWEEIIRSKKGKIKAIPLWKWLIPPLK